MIAPLVSPGIEWPFSGKQSLRRKSKEWWFNAGGGPGQRPVECANRLLTPTEKNYTTTEKKDSVAYVVTAVDHLERPLGKYHVSHLFEDEVAPGKRNPKFDDRPQDEVTSNEGAFRTGPVLEKTKDEDCRHWKKEDLLVLRIQCNKKTHRGRCSASHSPPPALSDRHLGYFALFPLFYLSPRQSDTFDF
ncbi:hypothetical protein MTP99_007852 [Tenebrio molitor]|jgi:hypothetical protein|nr:hypothetical protein MTP99_007852 [Tenebrio molitor]